MKYDYIERTKQLYDIIKNVIDKGGTCRIDYCSVAEVMYKNENDKMLTEIEYTIGLATGPFGGEVKEFNIKNPVYMCKRDILNFVVESLSNSKSPYFYNEKTGKFDYQMLVM